MKSSAAGMPRLSGTEFLDIYADLPENEKPKSGWDRALEELEEDSETK